MSLSHAYGYQHDDDKLMINSRAQSLAVVAPAEPKSKKSSAWPESLKMQLLAVSHRNTHHTLYFLFQKKIQMLQNDWSVTVIFARNQHAKRMDCASHRWKRAKMSLRIRTGNKKPTNQSNKTPFIHFDFVRALILFLINSFYILSPSYLNWTHWKKKKKFNSDKISVKKPKLLCPFCPKSYVLDIRAAETKTQKSKNRLKFPLHNLIKFIKSIMTEYKKNQTISPSFWLQIIAIHTSDSLKVPFDLAVPLHSTIENIFQKRTNKQTESEREEKW